MAMNDEGADADDDVDDDVINSRVLASAYFRVTLISDIVDMSHSLLFSVGLFTTPTSVVHPPGDDRPRPHISLGKFFPLKSKTRGSEEPS